jgi:hypothetical protein
MNKQTLEKCSTHFVYVPHRKKIFFTLHYFVKFFQWTILFGERAKNVFEVDAEFKLYNRWCQTLSDCRHLWTISPTCLLEAFTCVYHKSGKWLMTLIVILGFMSVKASRKMLVKSTPRVNFINMLTSIFLCSQILWCSTSVLPTILCPTLPVHSTRSSSQLLRLML